MTLEGLCRRHPCGNQFSPYDNGIFDYITGRDTHTITQNRAPDTRSFGHGYVIPENRFVHFRFFVDRRIPAPVHVVSPLA